MTDSDYLGTFVVGQRVRLHPATDAWMQGRRYGTIKRFTMRDNGTPIVVVTYDDGASGKHAARNILTLDS